MDFSKYFIYQRDEILTKSKNLNNFEVNLYFLIIPPIQQTKEKSYNNTYKELAYSPSK